MFDSEYDVYSLNMCDICPLFNLRRRLRHVRIRISCASIHTIQHLKCRICKIQYPLATARKYSPQYVQILVYTIRYISKICLAPYSTSETYNLPYSISSGKCQEVFGIYYVQIVQYSIYSGSDFRTIHHLEHTICHIQNSVVTVQRYLQNYVQILVYNIQYIQNLSETIFNIWYIQFAIFNIQWQQSRGFRKGVRGRSGTGKTFSKVRIRKISHTKWLKRWLLRNFYQPSKVVKMVTHAIHKNVSKAAL